MALLKKLVMFRNRWSRHTRLENDLRSLKIDSKSILTQLIQLRLKSQLTSICSQWQEYEAEMRYCLDQQRYVVVVFWAWCILPVWSSSPKIWPCVQWISVLCTLNSPQLLRGRGYASNSWTLTSNRQNTANSIYNDDISLLISQYLISGKLQEAKNMYMCIVCIANRNKIKPKKECEAPKSLD